MALNQFELIIYIPTFNRKEKLKNSLNIISKEIKGLEDKVLVYVSNNGSSDGTGEYLESLDYKWIHTRHNEENVGAAMNILHSFNLPIKSDFIWLIGDDDYLTPNSISELLSLIKDYPEADYIFCNTKAFSSQNSDEVLSTYFQTGLVDGGRVKSRKYTGTALVDFEQLINPDIADTLLGELMVHCFRQSSIQFDIKEIIGLNSITADWDNLDFETAGKITHPHVLPFLKCFNRLTKAIYCDAPRTFNFWGSAEWLGNYDFSFPIGILFLISQYKKYGFISDEKFFNLLDYYYSIMRGSLARQVCGQSTARPFNSTIKAKMFEFLFMYVNNRSENKSNVTTQITPGEYSVTDGEKLFGMGDIEGAKKIFMQVLSGSPNSIEALNNLGVIAFQQGKIDQSVCYFTRVLETDDNYFEAITNLGKCTEVQKDYLKAAELFERALRLRPKEISVLNSLGNCFIQMKNFERARDAYEKSLRLDNGQENIKAIVQKLIGLKNAGKGIDAIIRTPHTGDSMLIQSKKVLLNKDGKKVQSNYEAISGLKKGEYCIWIVNVPGNIHHTFDEIALGLKAAFRKLGFDSPIVTDPKSITGTAIVLGCNRLAQLQITKLPENIILYNLEQVQPNSPWMSDKYLDLLKSHPVWDYSQLNIEESKKIGVADVTYCGIGFEPELTKIPQVEEDIDILFYGSINDRRRKVLEALKESGLNVVILFGEYGDKRDEYIARSKIILNLHYYEAKLFEIVRISYLLANKKFIISEPGSDINFEKIFDRGIVFSKIEDMVENCHKYLKEENLRREIAAKGFEIFKKISQAEFLKEAIKSNQAMNNDSFNKQKYAYSVI